jgi:uncharacterized damage-inducible protein DinB
VSASPTASPWYDAFAHHIWANERLLDACAGLTPGQLDLPVAGTYGPIMDTFRHLVATDGWYLTFFFDRPNPIDEDVDATLAELRVANASNGAAWMELLSNDLDTEADVVEHGDGWDYHSPVGFRLAQAVHHGTDHRSQICTGLTSLGIEPPAIDVWAYGEATGRSRGVDLEPSTTPTR